MPVITLSRQAGSLGDEVAQALAHKLGWELLTRETVLSRFFSGNASPHELHMLTESAKFYFNPFRGGETFLEYLKNALYDYAKENSAVLVGFGSQVVFADREEALHVRVTAPEALRVSRVKKQYRVSDAEAADILSISDKKHRRFVSVLFGADLADGALYDLTLNTGSMSVYECMTVVLALLRERELGRRLDGQAETAGAVSSVSELPLLKNPSEVEFARILDMYQIEWKYEPKTFPIEWDAEGGVALAFSPDFYLTAYDTYIELTTMNQKYINKKMKKINRLRELYPNINIRIVNRRSFHSLLERFGPILGGEV